MKSTIHPAVVIILLSAFTNLTVAQTTVFSENFQGNGIPSGWTQQTNASDGGWKFGLASALSSGNWTIPNHTRIAATNDDGCNCDKSNDLLISPSIDLSSVTMPILSVDVFFEGGTYQGKSESAQIQVSTNGGNTYTTVKNITGASDWQTIEVNLTAYAGASDLKVAFKYSDGTGFLFGWAIDNVMIFEPVALDVALSALDITDIVTVSHIAPTKIDIKGTVENRGTTQLTSVDVNWSVNNGVTNSQTIGLNLDYGETTDFTHSEQLSIDKPEFAAVKVWLSNLNSGNLESNTANNELSANVTGAGGLVEKNVLLEEVSGAWCGWCPLGAYVLDQLRPDPNVIAVTIHGKSGGSGDDMEIPDGRTIINSYITGYPQGFIDRTPFETFGDPPAIAIGFSSSNTTNDLYWTGNTELQKAKVVVAAIELSNTFDAASRELVVDLAAHFLGPVNGANYRVNAYIIEDSVSGTGNGYNQQNYVSSQHSSGGRPGHFYYDFPPVIVGFQHMQVLRAMLGGPWGSTGVVPDSIGFNDKFEHQYTYTLPADWKEKDIFIVGVVQEYNTDINKRPIVNAVEADLNSTGTTKVTLTYDPTSGVNSLHDENILIHTYPNPATDYIMVELTLKELSRLELRLVNLLGQEIQKAALNNLQYGKNKVAINTSGLSEGIYLLHISSEKPGEQFSEKILIGR